MEYLLELRVKSDYKLDEVINMKDIQDCFTHANLAISIITKLPKHKKIKYTKKTMVKVIKR